MAKTIDLELIQDSDTNFILYDDTNRVAAPANVITISTIDRITITFTEDSDDLNEDKTFVIDSSKKGIHEGIVDLTGGFNWAASNQTLLISYQGGTTQALTLTANAANLTAVVSEINTKLTAAGLGAAVEAYEVAATYVGLRTLGTGVAEYFELYSAGTAMSTIGFSAGIYRGNGIDFATATQDEVQYIIYPEDFGEGFTEIPEASWEIETDTDYTDGGSFTYEEDWSEFTYKQSELYWAQAFADVARDPYAYREFENRDLLDDEKQFYKYLIYDARLKALKAAIAAGDKTSARNMVTYMEDFRDQNEIEE